MESKFKIGDKVTWRQNFSASEHPMSEQGFIEDIKDAKALGYNCESGVMIKVTFYRSAERSSWHMVDYLDSNWLKLVNELI